ncbi:type IX secretion system membrane protein PorP/SprF [Flavobacteriaceae bacterium F89]|uniref:Type IX secretion system membrane protein PorP/SprF n=1 Tax=Cerina litoralis TaxID=2874477 RepID=A0AAE3EZB9_9FLAO|nr:type IX secretion system membrane protein PorP/SprF [Cerina litoralis]MCG2462472.1 type IX secretion system membrane protein PorP/SprF [Cerina litoralis]
MKKYIIIFISVIVCTQVSRAQQAPQYTEYMYNTIVINPAYAGSRGAPSISALYRSQWMGLDGSPSTQNLGISAPITKRVGLGLSIVHDEIGNGTRQTTDFNAAFSYTIPVSYTGNLAFGLNAGGNFLNVDFSKLINYGVETNLPNIDNKFSPNFGAGVYYYTERFYAGLSVPDFLQTKHFDNSGETSSYVAKDRMNLYLISGYVLDLNGNVKFRPAVMIKGVSGAPLQADVSASFMFSEKFVLGAAYRWDATVSALASFQVLENFMIGLAYDMDTTSLGNTEFNDGSFEIFIRYDFLNRYNQRAFKNRFF